MPSPTKFSHDISNYNKPKNVPLYQRRPEFEPSQTDKISPKKVVGYVGYNCCYYLEFEAIQVIYDPGANDKITWKRHACDPGILSSTKAYPTFAREDFWMYRTLNLPKQMIKAVKEWTNEVFLMSEKLTSSEVPESTITLDLHENEYSWLTRAVVQKYTILNDKELKEFFTLIVEWCATSVVFVLILSKKKGNKM